MSDGDLVRRITISATGEGIDNTTASVIALGDALGNTASATTGWDSAIDGLGRNITGLGAALSGAGIVGGLSAILDYVVRANKELSDMGTTATQVGLSLKDFQSIQFGAAIASLNTDQINAGLEKSASLLKDASIIATRWRRNWTRTELA
jgi:hypothetical protein